MPTQKCIVSYGMYGFTLIFRLFFFCFFLFLSCSFIFVDTWWALSTICVSYFFLLLSFLFFSFLFEPLYRIGIFCAFADELQSEIERHVCSRRSVFCVSLCIVMMMMTFIVLWPWNDELLKFDKWKLEKLLHRKILYFKNTKETEKLD